MVGVGLGAVGPLLTRVVVDDAVAGSTAALVPVVTALVVLALVQYGASFVRRYFAGRLSLDVQHDLRRRVFDAVARLDGERQDALRTGQVASRAITDLQLVQGLLSMVPFTLGTATLVVTSVAAMLWLSPLLTLVTLVVLPAAAIVTVRSRRSLFPATWSAQQQAADVAQQVEETVTGVRVVKGFGQEDREVATLEGRARRLYAERMRAARMTARLNPALLALPTLGQVGGDRPRRLRWRCHGSITLGTFLAFTTYVAQLVGPARMMGALVVTAQLARAGVERVYDLVDAEPEVVDPPDPVPVPPGPLSVRAGRRAVRLRTAVRRCSTGCRCASSRGRRSRWSAPPGSGKSTVAQLLAALLRPAGRAGAARRGGAARRCGWRTCARVLGVVFEDAFLFSDTIRANIAYGRPDATDEQVVAAAEAAQVAEFVEGLPEGYDTRGRRARADALRRAAAAGRAGPGAAHRPARAGARRRDVRGRHATEAAIHATLRDLTTDRTTLLVAHRRSTLALADRIAVLDRGRVVDVGTETELRGPLPAVPDAVRRGARGRERRSERRCRLRRPHRTPRSLHRRPTPAARATAEAAARVRRRRAVARRPIAPVRLHREARRQRSTRGAGAPMSDLGGIAATPELLAAVDALPPATDVPRLPGEDPTAPDPGFRLARLLRPVRGLLAADDPARLASTR